MGHLLTNSWGVTAVSVHGAESASWLQWKMKHENPHSTHDTQTARVRGEEPGRPPATGRGVTLPPGTPLRGDILPGRGTSGRYFSRENRHRCEHRSYLCPERPRSLICRASDAVHTVLNMFFPFRSAFLGSSLH